MSIIQVTFRNDGVLSDPTSVKLSDPDATFGVKRNDNNDVVVADDTAMTQLSTGVYSHTFTDPAVDLIYTFWIETVDAGETVRTENLFAGPTSFDEPVTLAEAKLHLHVTHSAEDDLITRDVKAARRYCEKFTRRQFMTATIISYFDEWPGAGEFRLGFPPLRSVTSIQYIDTDGATQTLSTDVYTVDTATEPGRVYRAFDQSWPAIRSQRNAIIITFSAGYGVASDVPDNIKSAMLLLIGHWFENRENSTTGTVNREISTNVEDLLWQERVMEVS